MCERGNTVETVCLLNNRKRKPDSYVRLSLDYDKDLSSGMVKNRDIFLKWWENQRKSGNLLEGYRTEKFMEYTKDAESLTEIGKDFIENVGLHQSFLGWHIEGDFSG